MEALWMLLGVVLAVSAVCIPITLCVAFIIWIWRKSSKK